MTIQNDFGMATQPLNAVLLDVNSCQYTEVVSLVFHFIDVTPSPGEKRAMKFPKDIQGDKNAYPRVLPVSLR